MFLLKNDETFKKLIGVNMFVDTRDSSPSLVANKRISRRWIPECELNFYFSDMKSLYFSCSGRAFFGGVFCGC